MTRRNRPTDLVHLELASGVSAFTGEPFVAITATDTDGNRMHAQMNPAEARHQGAVFFEASEAAVQDAVIYHFAAEVIGLDPNETGQLLVRLRDRRDQIDPTT